MSMKNMLNNGGLKIYANALDSIGNTPLIRLGRVHTGPVNVWAKMECIQPGGSVKDRAAKMSIETALQTGKLQPGQSVVEMTSGNMGAGLAVVCGVYGHPFIATMSEGNSPQRAVMLRGLGAEVVLVPQVNGLPGQVTGDDIEAAAQAARRIAQEQGAYYVDQFHAPHGIIAHEQGTAQEILTALDGSVDAFVAIVGSGGTFVGVSRGLKKHNAAIRCVAVEPKDAEILAGKQIKKKQHMLQGTGYGFIPPLWDPSLPDAFMAVSDEEAQVMRYRLAAEEGLYVGFSAAANVVAAVKFAHSGVLHSGANIVTILCDTGLKYS